MINKQGLWFLTLFSLILVLSIYYITMPNEMFLTNNNSTDINENIEEVTSQVEESNYITVLKIELETQRDELIKNLEQVLNSSDSTTKDKNNAYEQIKNLNTLKGIEEKLESKIKTTLKLNAFAKVDNNEVTRFLDSNKHIDYHVAFFKAGINAIIKKWINNGCKESPEEILEVITSEYKGRKVPG